MGKESAEVKGRARLYRILKSAVAVFATFFIVIGVAVVAFLARDTVSENEKSSLEMTETTVRKISVFLMVGENKASIYKVDGTYIRDLSWPDDTNILSTPLSQLKGVRVDNGKLAWLNSGFVRATSTMFRSPDGRREAFIGEKRKDGSIPLMLRYGNEQDSRILRVDNGKLLKDVIPVGFLTGQSFAVIGSASGTKALYEFMLGGGYNYLAPITEGAVGFSIVEGEICYIQTELSHEMMKRAPPEKIIKIDKSGERHVLTDDLESVVLGYVYGQGVLAYALVDRSLFIKDENQAIKIGSGVPLMILPDGGLLYSGDKKIMIRDKDGQTSELFDEGDYWLFYLENVAVDDRDANSIN